MLKVSHIVIHPTFSSIFGRNNSFKQKTLEEMTEVQIQIKPKFMEVLGPGQAGFEYSATFLFGIVGVPLNLPHVSSHPRAAQGWNVSG